MADYPDLKVRLVAQTPRAEEVVALAARLCYSSLPTDRLREDLAGEKTKALLQSVIDRGHHSVLEHAYFSFLVEGISRVTTHQLVRHRIGCSYSQRSQRYVREEGPVFIVPPAIRGDAEMKEVFLQSCENDYRRYLELTKKGVHQEAARYLLPQAIESKIMVTMSARALHHFFRLRCCGRAQGEIRTLARRMLSLVQEAAPALFYKAGPFCELGECPEGEKSCGRLRQTTKRNGQNADQRP